MIQKYVTFYSPGTFVAEETTKKVDEWNVDLAIKMSKKIKERYGALPYGFQFSTRERGENDLDSHEAARSPFYYLGGEILTLAQVKALNDSDNHILIQNMESNHWNKIVINTNSYKWTQPLKETDVVLDIKS